MLAGTVWQNYQLIGVQNPVNPIVNNKPQGTGQGSGQCYAAGTNHATMPEFQINDCYLANVAWKPTCNRQAA